MRLDNFESLKPKKSYISEQLFFSLTKNIPKNFNRESFLNFWDCFLEVVHSQFSISQVKIVQFFHAYYHWQLFLEFSTGCFLLGRFPPNFHGFIIKFHLKKTLVKFMIRWLYEIICIWGYLCLKTKVCFYENWFSPFLLYI